jgi:hypothetical protein
MPIRLSVLLPLALAVATPLAAQEHGEPLVYQGARVLGEAPVLGKGWLPGQFASAGLRGGVCLGVAFDSRDAGGAQTFVLLKGITALRVDRRTNSGILSLVDIAPAADSDWIAIDLVTLHRQDQSCNAAPTPAPR